MMIAVSLVTPREYLFNGGIDAPPPFPTLAESLNCRLSTGAFVRNSGHQVSHYLAVTDDGNGVSVLDHS